MLPSRTVDRDERDVDAVGRDGLGHSLNPAAVARVVERVGPVADHVADRLRRALVVGGNGLDPEPAEVGVVADSERGVRRPARTLGRDVSLPAAQTNAASPGEHVRQRAGVEVSPVGVAGRDDVDEREERRVDDESGDALVRRVGLRVPRS